MDTKYAPLASSDDGAQTDSRVRPFSRRRTVYFMPFVQSIDVDPVSMTSTLSIEVALHWLVEGMENLISQKGEFYELREGVVDDSGDSLKLADSSIWFPNLKLDRTYDWNGRDPVVIEIDVHRPKAGFTGPGGLHMYAYLRFSNVRVKHVFDLRTFPFDRECITYYFMLEDQLWSEAILELHCPEHIFDCMGCLDEGASANTDTSNVIAARLVPDVSTEEWSNVMRAHDMGTDRERYLWSEGKAPMYANMELRLDVARQSFFYILKVAAVVFVLLLMESATFIMPVGFADRSSVILTLFLTAVAFQYAVAGFIPALTYNTSLDKLILFMYIMLFLAFVQNMAVAVLFSDSLGKPMNDSIDARLATDMACLCAYVAIVIVYCAAFIYSGFKHGAIPKAEYTQLYTYMVDKCLPTSMVSFDVKQQETLKRQCTVWDPKIEGCEL